VGGEVVDNYMDLAPARMSVDEVAQNSTNAALVWRGTVCPMISPVCVLSAAYSESVPWL